MQTAQGSDGGRAAGSAANQTTRVILAAVEGRKGSDRARILAAAIAEGLDYPSAVEIVRAVRSNGRLDDVAARIRSRQATIGKGCGS